jgi:hypothetical protein
MFVMGAAPGGIFGKLASIFRRQLVEDRIGANRADAVS